jgi:hypothetical protein
MKRQLTLKDTIALNVSPAVSEPISVAIKESGETDEIPFPFECLYSSRTTPLTQEMLNTRDT